MFAYSVCLNILLIQCMFTRAEIAAEWIEKVNPKMIYE